MLVLADPSRGPYFRFRGVGPSAQEDPDAPPASASPISPQRRAMEVTKINLALCPQEILALDRNAETLWRVLLRKVGITVSKGEHIEDKRAWILRNFGLPDLANRLAVQQ